MVGVWLFMISPSLIALLAALFVCILCGHRLLLWLAASASVVLVGSYSLAALPFADSFVAISLLLYWVWLPSGIAAFILLTGGLVRLGVAREQRRNKSKAR